MLYCLPSVHPECTYHWIKIGEKKAFPSTPFVFVNKAGHYQCTISFANKKLQSNVITVQVDVGKKFM